tara:strand:+ start:162 stop:746 length:585 start_codon:yes stop_codon:yes gene_type:complete
MATGKCEMCGNQGEVEEHHIIGREAIKRIQPGEHGFDLDLMKRSQNLMTLCIPCHRLTDSHQYRRWWRWREKEGENPESREARIQRRRKEKAENRKKNWAKKGRSQCLGKTKSGRRCMQTARAKSGYCKYHRNQAKKSEAKPEPTEPPGLHDEGRLDEEQMFALEDFHGFGMPYDESLFDEKSDLWKKEWLTRR